MIGDRGVEVSATSVIDEPFAARPNDELHNGDRPIGPLRQVARAGCGGDGGNAFNTVLSDALKYYWSSQIEETTVPPLDRAQAGAVTVASSSGQSRRCSPTGQMVIGGQRFIRRPAVECIELVGQIVEDAMHCCRSDTSMLELHA